MDTTCIAVHQVKQGSEAPTCQRGTGVRCVDAPQDTGHSTHKAVDVCVAPAEEVDAVRPHDGADKLLHLHTSGGRGVTL